VIRSEKTRDAFTTLLRGNSSMPVTGEQVVMALRDVADPELGMSVVDLGLVYAVLVEGGRVRVTMTLTAPGCPIHDSMSEWVRQAVMNVPGVTEAEVTVTFAPPWTPERIGQGLLPG